MQKPFNDAYEVIDLRKVNKGRLKAFVKFKSVRTRRRLGRAELWVDKIGVWLILAGEEDLGDPQVLIRHIYKSQAEKLRLTTNHALKQTALNVALYRYFRLTDERGLGTLDCLRDFLLSAAWKKWGVGNSNGASAPPSNHPMNARKETIG